MINPHKPQQKNRTLIRGGWIVDGSGAPAYHSDFVIERGLMTLEEAIHKMTGLPAERFGIQDRGLLREGMQADLLLFDPNRFRDTASFEDPVRLAEGMDYVFVNGKLTWSDGRMQQQDAGHVILGN